jgi:hypothetical protein
LAWQHKCQYFDQLAKTSIRGCTQRIEDLWKKDATKEIAHEVKREGALGQGLNLEQGFSGNTHQMEQDPLKRAGAEWSFEEAIEKLERFEQEVSERNSQEREAERDQTTLQEEVGYDSSPKSTENAQKERKPKAKEQELEEERSRGMSWTL